MRAQFLLCRCDQHASQLSVPTEVSKVNNKVNFDLWSAFEKNNIKTVKISYHFTRFENTA